MNEQETSVVLVSIDTSERMGATSIYGVYELVKILEAGAKINGYKNVVISHLDREIKVSGRCVLTAVIS